VDREQVVAEATTFIVERLAKTLTDEGLARDTIDAVLPTSHDFLDLRKRALTLHEFRGAAGWDDLVTVFSRPSNLAKKLPPEAVAAGLDVDADVFVVEAEMTLFTAWQEGVRGVGEAVKAEDYATALETLAGLRPAVDRYFDDVLVMAEDEAVRFNRLRQLAALAATVRLVAHLDLVQA
jgi:glycyl-tRNA synthetase beta chain